MKAIIFDLAVSYTHLDVYKRQPLLYGEEPIRGVTYVSRDFDRFEIEPVSYTHLSKRKAVFAP